MISASCHPDRRHYAKGLCRLCYRRANEKPSPDVTKERNARWYSKRKDTFLKAKRGRYASAPEKSLIRNRAWRKENLELCRTHTHKRRAREAGGGGLVTQEQWLEIVEVFCDLCAYCLRPCEKPEREHFRPLSKMGENSTENVIPACRRCNLRKNDGLIFEFLQRGVGV